MLCWIRKKKLFEYAIGQMNAGEAKKIEAHLKNCSKCREYVSRLQKINSVSASDEQPFLSEVFWRKFDERLDLNIAQQQKKPVNIVARNMKLLPRPLPAFAFNAAVAVCVLLIFIVALFNHSFRGMTVALQDEALIETVLLVEDAAELNLNGDEDAYIEEILLQMALDEA